MYDIIKLKITDTIEISVIIVIIKYYKNGLLAQLVERLVRNQKAAGSNPAQSIKLNYNHESHTSQTYFNCEIIRRTEDRYNSCR